MQKKICLPLIESNAKFTSQKLLIWIQQTCHNWLLQFADWLWKVTLVTVTIWRMPCTQYDGKYDLLEESHYFSYLPVEHSYWIAHEGVASYRSIRLNSSLSDRSDMRSSSIFFHLALLMSSAEQREKVCMQPVTRFPSPATSHPPPATHHPPSLTHYPPPATHGKVLLHAHTQITIDKKKCKCKNWKIKYINEPVSSWRWAILLMLSKGSILQVAHLNHSW